MVIVIVIVVAAVLGVAVFAAARRRTARERAYAGDGPSDPNWSGGDRPRGGYEGGYPAGPRGDSGPGGGHSP